MGSDKDITINLTGTAAPERPRYMFVLFTLEHRAYSISEACELAARLKAEGVENLYCVKIDCEPIDTAGGLPLLGAELVRGLT